LLLQFLARALHEHPTFILGTHRTVVQQPEHPLEQTFAELLRVPGAQRLVLGGWSDAEVQRYVELVAGGAAPAELIATLHRYTEGNPLFVAEFVRMLDAEGVLTGGLQAVPFAMPEGVRAVIGRRLAPLSPACVELLKLASTMGRQFRVDVLERAA